MVSLVILFHLIFFPSLSYFTHFGVSFSFGGIVSSPMLNLILFLLCRKQQKIYCVRKIRKEQQRKIRKMKPKLSWFHLKDVQNVFEVKMRSFVPLQVASWYTKTIYSHVINTCEAQTRCPEYCAYLLIGIVYGAHVFYGRRLSLLPASDIERFRWFLFCSTSNWFSVWNKSKWVWKEHYFYPKYEYMRLVLVLIIWIYKKKTMNKEFIRSLSIEEEKTTQYHFFTD